MNKMKLNIPMYAALVLLLLTLITTHITSGLYARYTGVVSGSENVRVAKFKVACDVEPVSDEEGKYTLTVTNDSEVAVKYSIVVEMSDHLSAAISGEKKTLAAGETFVTFENDAWTLAPSESEPLPLQFAVENWKGITDPDTNNGASEKVPFGFKVKVTAEQID